MKTLLFTTIFCLTALVSLAQWDGQPAVTKKHNLYSSGEYVVGEQQAGNIGLSYTYNNKYILSMGYTATFKSTVTPTAEFLKSASNLSPATTSVPFENTENLHMMVGRIFDLNKKSSVRLVLQGGPGISTFREPEFNLTQSGDQYNFETQTSKKFSLVLNPKVELPLYSSLGCSVGPMVMVNSNQTYIGAGIGIMYGLIKND
ncbi:hypothetical protein SLH46_16075 [Draconibacterium sp. IB214405]|uniref:hypothetical protein n=1 Tax=Draconibacterium sp. IB214405 TaxID=3097352 RepID=UPI002A0F1CA6|nr:hypothetical protein [Draconibacterium sp. IB214405]MDX8340715.1 hypothetical protein [Draconibacterium sp. IB214405]